METLQNTPAECAMTAMDNFHVEQLRLENAWLRERLRVMGRRIFQSERQAAAVRVMEHVRDCRCQICVKN